MGTNYYRIPTHEEVEKRKALLIEEIKNLPISPSDIERGFSEQLDGSWESFSPWDMFNLDMKIHLGKRSWGWKFCWNFNDNKFYSNKEELLAFIRSGRIVDEYGREEPVEEFIEMALSWCPDGLVGNEEYHRNSKAKNSSYWFSESFFDKEIDGLRVSSSTEFC
jgi:hypothetical protein